VNAAARSRWLPYAAEQAIDARTGIIHQLRSFDVPAGAPPLFHFSAQLCNLRACGWESNFARMDATSARREHAAIGAVTEAFRFYAAAFYSRAELELLRFDDDPDACADPQSFALFSEGQYARPGFPYVPFTRSTAVRWVDAIDAATGHKRRLPAALTRTPYHVPEGDEEASIAPASSAGLAAAASHAEAVCAGISDCVRADATALLWQARMARPQIRVETLSDANYDLVQRFETTAGAVSLIDARTEVGIPAVVACLRCHVPNAPALVFGAGSNPDPEAAVRQAVEELALVLRYCHDIALAGAGFLNSEDARDQADHLRYWHDPGNTQRADFLFRSRERIDFQSLPNLSSRTAEATQHELTKTLSAAGYSALIADLTPPDLRDLGLATVRVVVPGLQPIFIGNDRQALGGKRLRQLLSAGQANGTSGVRPPHPFLVRGIL
jgi:ribosomal protein S12 methylthiotransferase accessory factor